MAVSYEGSVIATANSNCELGCLLETLSARSMMSALPNKAPTKEPVAAADGNRSCSRRINSGRRGAATTMPKLQTAKDQRSSWTALKGGGGDSSLGAERNSKAGIRPVKPEVKGASPKAPATILMMVTSMGVTSLERRWRMLLNKANPSNVLCMGIAFTVPA